MKGNRLMENVAQKIEKSIHRAIKVIAKQALETSRQNGWNF